MDKPDPRLLLARRLRSLREEHWPDKRITQQGLAQVLGVSIPLISSWESHVSPRLPPLARLDAYARLFASQASFDARGGSALADADEQSMNELKRELMQLRNAAMKAGVPSAEPHQRPDTPVSSGPWWFPDGSQVTIACAQLPQYMLDRIPYTNVNDPDYIELLTYSELDSLFDLYGFVRAANPESLVVRRIASTLLPDDYHSHLAVLGGVDWNVLTRSTLGMLGLPVRQVADWTVEGGAYFEVDEDGTTTKHRPVLSRIGDHPELHELHEDVALFVRAVSPFNRERTVTICTGMYGRGTYGAVRALTDRNFRSRNSEYLETRFSDSEVYCILMRVPIIHGATLTPDWTIGDHTLFEWSR